MWEQKGTAADDWKDFLDQREELGRFIHDRVDLETPDDELDEYVMIKYADPEDLLRLLSDDVALFREVNTESMKEKDVLIHYVFPGIVPPTRGMKPHVYKLINQMSAHYFRVSSETRRKARADSFRYSVTNGNIPETKKSEGALTHLSSFLPRLTSAFF